MERLQKILSMAGASSRRAGEEMIAAGRVAVNGTVIKTPGFKADPAADVITLDGRKIAAVSSYAYVMLNKPEGVVTTANDPRGRQTVMDLVPKEPRIFPVGRLDFDTSGLLVLTNDGALAYALAHPKNMVPKIYVAKLRGVPDAESAEKFRAGLIINGRKTVKCGFEVTAEKNGCRALVTLTEGRNRQVRKMCAQIGHPVVKLKRVAVGPLRLGGLREGQWRILTPGEVKKLRQCAGMADK
ncbi:MAG: rRNA pseudouridine synthase [Defluviitaleaceae bacterium]|nr:rRNA pseudouridine synthase [Defluviitaleaceae bacterium]